MNNSSVLVSQDQYSVVEAEGFLEIIINHELHGEIKTTQLDMIGGFRIKLMRDNQLPYQGTAEVTSNGKAIVSIRFYGNDGLLAQVPGATLDEKISYTKRILDAY